MSEVRNLSAFAALLSDVRFGEHILPALSEDLRQQVVTVLTQKEGEIRRARNLVAGVSNAVEVLEGGVSRQVRSIFCSLTADDQQAPEAKYWPLGVLKMEENALFPANALPEQKAVEEQETLWGTLRREVEKLQAAYTDLDDLPTFIETMLLLLQRYTWSMPNAFGNKLPDVSLYDHSRLTAALATAMLATAMEEQGQEGELALLVGGGLSGIQDFIYTITARGATSALRGRSFYLQLLTEAAARYTLRRLDLPLTSLIYVGGGHFYLIASPTQAKELETIQREISRVLFHHHRGDLYLALENVPLQEADFLGGEFSQKWGALHEAIRLAKLRRFSELGDELRTIFQPQGHGGNEAQQCQVCGQENSRTGTDPQSITGNNPEGVRKCPACLSFEQLGGALRNAKYLGLEHLPLDDAGDFHLIGEPGEYEKVLKQMGLHALPLATVEDVPSTSNPITVLALEDDALSRIRPTKGRALGRRFFVNVTPLLRKDEIDYLKTDKHLEELPDYGAIKPFDAMEAQAHGIPRLGILRMDVDNLGSIFSKGFGPQANLSRIAALSFAVSLYFEGWVEVLADQRNRNGRGDVARGDRLYSIYSGGDDLFFVGAWDEIAELARQIRSDLRGYAADHPGIHASAGIVLVGGKYPLSQAAEDAAKEEEAAKMLRWLSGQKNDEQEQRDSQKPQEPNQKDAISFLGLPLPWEQFGLAVCEQTGLENAHSAMHELVKLVEEKNTNRALLRRLIGLHARYLEADEKRRKVGMDQNKAGERQTLWGPWMWLGYYFLSRMARDSKNTHVKDLAEKLKADDFRSMSWIGLAARWAELWLRD